MLLTNYGRDISRGIQSRQKSGRVEVGISIPTLEQIGFEIGQAIPTYPKSWVGSEWPIPTYTIFEGSWDKSGYIPTFELIPTFEPKVWISHDFILTYPNFSRKLAKKVGIKSRLLISTINRDVHIQIPTFLANFLNKSG